MEGITSADGVYPDFSVLEEVLLPPCISSDQSWSNLGEEWTRLISELQYCDPPHGVTGEQRGPETSMNMSCRRRSARGRQICCNSRLLEGKAEKFPSHDHTNKLKQHSRYTKSCVVQLSEWTALSLLEESVRSIPKSEKTEDQAWNGRSRINNFNQTSVLRSSYRMSQSSCSKAMEVLNLINSECNQLTKRGVEEESRLLVQSEVHGDCRRHLEVNNNIFDLDRSCCSSTSKERGAETPAGPQWVITDTEPLCEECHTSTLCKVQNVKTTGGSITGGSSDGVRCLQRTPRKQKTPMRSVEKSDPNFQGIEFQMHLCYEKEKCDAYRLIVTSLYSPGRKRTKFRSRMKSSSPSSGSDEHQTPRAPTRMKRCASCKTQKTPLWRDAEDGTPLCNACGIRYKKYGVRCGECWNIPKKDGKSCSRYCGCGGEFRALI